MVDIITNAQVRANATVEKVESQKIALINTVEGLEIRNDDDLALGVEILADFKKRYKYIEEDRKTIVDPINQALKVINGKYKPAKDFLEKLIKKLDQEKITPYSVEQINLKRVEAERIQQVEFDRKAAEAQKLEDKATDQGSELAKEFVEDIEAEALKIADQEVVVNKTVRTETATNTLRARWVCEVTDSKKVPRQYCEPVNRLLTEAVKNGLREIDGCIIKEVYSSTTR